MNQTIKQSAKEILSIKAAVRERDNYCCTKCGMTLDQHIAKYKKILDVHRLAPGSAYSLDACVTLCRACHGPEPRLPAGMGETVAVALPAKLKRQLKLVSAVTGERMSDYVVRILGPAIENDYKDAVLLLLADGN